ncbi:MAG: hypothetical protein R3A45_09920 [Bdellovibrionota bacterium]
MMIKAKDAVYIGIFSFVAVTLLFSSIAYSKHHESNKNMVEQKANKIFKESKQALEKMKRYSIEEINLVSNLAERELEDVNKEIIEMKKAINKKTKKETHAAMRDLDKLVQDARNKVGAFKKSTQESWEDLKKNVEDAFNEVEDSYKNALESQ